MSPILSNFYGEPETHRPWHVFAAARSARNDRSTSSSRLEPVTIIGLTQFAFLTLGGATLKILVHSVSSISPFARRIDAVSLWLFSIPVVWTISAAIIAQTNKGPLLTFTANVIGILLAALSLLFLFAVVFFLPAYL